MSSPWYQKWFGKTYKSVYSHRSSSQAESQVNFLLTKTNLSRNSRILDVACGSGRHLKSFLKKGHNAFGIDLSWELLQDCRKNEFRVTRGNMLRLPFRDSSVDLLTCFFTSFGYFSDPNDDFKTLLQFGRVLKSNGFLFLDLMNPEDLKKNLVGEDRQESDGMTVIQKRRIEGGKVLKEISVTHANGRVENHVESVRLYQRYEAEILFKKVGFETVSLFGDEKGRCFNSDHSPRMSFLLRNRNHG